MSNKVKVVDCQESLAAKVGRFLLSKGFALASCIGRAKTLEELTWDDSLGILCKDPEVKLRKRLFGLITAQELRRTLLGVVWFGREFGASEQDWILVVYSRQHLELLRQLAEEMALAFNVKITLRLEAQSRAEVLPSEHWY